jgi:hypothetical protein
LSGASGPPQETTTIETMSSEPLQIQARLAALLEKAHADERVRAEMARARREFFGSDQPAYVDPADRTAMDVAAQRFAEWFLVERPSEVLGNTPAALLGSGDDADEALLGSRCGLFLVESAIDQEVQVRDLEGGERLGLVGVPLDLGPGDVLVGRVYPTAKGSYAPSAVLTVLSRSPQIAVAFQRDLRQLGLDRRLQQIEIEHLVFQRWAVGGMSGDEDRAPLEHIEADLQQLLERASVGDVHPAAGISQALRDAGEHPGAVIGPLMDELAFHTEVDLDRLRELLLQLSNAHRSAAKLPRQAAPGVAAPARKRPASAGQKSDALPGEGLGARLARRLDEGLAASEDVDALFRDVERLLGESLDDDEEDEDLMTGPDPEVGDLEPLVREFLWEVGEPPDTDILDELVQLQRAAPVPRLSVEYLEPDDYLRFVLQTWLANPPSERVSATQAAFSAVERFVDWLRTTQDLDLRDRLGTARDVLVARIDTLHAASLALSGGAPTGHEDAAGLARVLYCTDGGVELECESGRLRIDVASPSSAVAGLGEGDLILGTLARPAPGAGHFVGDAVALPRAVEHLLG